MAKTKLQEIKRRFSQPDVDSYSLVDWKTQTAKIVNPRTEEVVFEQVDVEFPVSWSLNAINIVSQKYFAGDLGTPERESSFKDLVDRVVKTLSDYGQAHGYFDQEQADIFVQELKYILITQRAAFNSPVWFNIGVPSRTQQASACFILSIKDDMPSILEWIKEEGMIFKGGSGSGVNLSALRSSLEGLSSSSGKASGPVSFMRGADASAGTIQSGGKTRRAAKMVILNVDHPDIEEFIWCKAREEKKMRVLAEAGFDMGVDGQDAYSVQYQNANNSVRITDKFMQAVVDDTDWELRGVRQKKTLKNLKARELFRQITQAAWECADPGVQFDDTINDWHTTPKAGRINASNPCSEYMHIDDSACNLASINLLAFLDDDGHFLVDDFLHTIEMVTLAQEILVGYADYPTTKIAKNAKAYRQLGLGYANLGALLMSQGIPYDSASGRAQAAALTAIMTGQAYATSARIARKIGPFAGYDQDQVGTLRVLKKHQAAVAKIEADAVPEELLTTASSVWDEALSLAEQHGVRNSQATVLAPTGTIGLMMDCDTTGIEPDLGLIKIKSLVGGGTMQFINQSVGRALGSLGYDQKTVEQILQYIEENQTIVDAPNFDSKHLPVFACSMGDNVIEYLGHVKMMAAVQPFISGAISKTVNLPESTTVQEVEELYLEAWRMGVKALAIFRDNCKVAQPLQVGKGKTQDKEDLSADFVVKGAVRRSLPRIRDSKTFKFRVADAKGYMTVGQFEDGTPGEIFVRVAKQGSTLAGIMDALAVSVSQGLQYGVPLRSYVRAFINMSFSPQGITDDPDIRTATSLVDYMFRRLGKTYLSYEELVELGIIDFSEAAAQEAASQGSLIEVAPPPTTDQTAPMCIVCGNQTQRAGGCYVCRSCGATTGCS